ncbi:ATP-binding protein (plasmid) [Tomitella fengzijianii]|uniref:ATP-binding protein n=1 Tax=Tomitella fengzijianii TaxID=2597660 RepID=A0A516X8W6_9ACTN|nr:ATP-binding protein [Tomitella fengzijianii]QDQ99514.1 ATP-binding protein [Tomitella fengzijianii]
MRPELNPFTPGSGLRPPALEGRGKQIDDFDLIVARSKRRQYDRGMMLSGLRGVGKTVLLNRLAEHAENQGWMVAQMEARATDVGVTVSRRRLIGELRRGVQRYSRRHDLQKKLQPVLEFVERLHLTLAAGPGGVTVTAGRGAQSAMPTMDWEYEFETLVEDIGAILAKHGSALGVFIDELQDIDDATLESLLAVQHTASQRGWPFFLVGAGLPNLPSRLAECRSYAERQFAFSTIGALAPADASDALTVPIREVGGDLSGEAREILLHAADGYPYFLQEYGKAVWAVAETVPFSPEDAHQAVDMGNIELDAGFYPSRWDRTNASEQAYLRGLAETGHDSPRSSDVAARIGKTGSSASPIRDSLIKKGLIWAPEYGRIAFTVPGMAAFIHRQPL